MFLSVAQAAGSTCALGLGAPRQPVVELRGGARDGRALDLGRAAGPPRQPAGELRGGACNDRARSGRALSGGCSAAGHKAAGRSAEGWGPLEQMDTELRASVFMTSKAAETARGIARGIFQEYVGFRFLSF